MGKKKTTDVEEVTVPLKKTKKREPSPMNPVVWKNEEQVNVHKTIKENTVTFVTGAPGTGKSFIAIATALQDMLVEKKIKRIFLTRPNVSTEDLGYLPGNLDDKISPFLQCLEIMVDDTLGHGKTYESLKKDKQIQIVPVGFMQGLTFDNEYVIVDEAEHLDMTQFYILLTRMGFNSKMIFCGDVGQTIISKPGFSFWMNKLQGVENVGIINMSIEAIVRHPVTKIVTKIWDEYRNPPECKK